MTELAQASGGSGGGGTPAGGGTPGTSPGPGGQPVPGKESGVTIPGVNAFPKDTSYLGSRLADGIAVAVFVVVLVLFIRRWFIDRT